MALPHLVTPPGAAAVITLKGILKEHLESEIHLLRCAKDDQQNPPSLQELEAQVRGYVEMWDPDLTGEHKALHPDGDPIERIKASSKLVAEQAQAEREGTESSVQEHLDCIRDIILLLKAIDDRNFSRVVKLLEEHIKSDRELHATVARFGRIRAQTMGTEPEPDSDPPNVTLLELLLPAIRKFATHECT